MHLCLFSRVQRQPAFDAFDGSLFAVFPSLNEEQTLQEVPTGLDSISHGKLSPERAEHVVFPDVGRGERRDHAGLL